MSAETNLEADLRPLDVRLRAYGCPSLIRLDQQAIDPAQVDYLDLLPKSRGSAATPLAGVVESQGTALLYILDGAGTQELNAVQLAQLQRRLANRSDPAWLGVARFGSLELYPISFGSKDIAGPAMVVQEADLEAPLFFQSLVQGTFNQAGEAPGTDYVFHKIFELLKQTTEAFLTPELSERRLNPLDVLSMAGRVLFFRFLIDRRIVRENELSKICPAADGLKDAFATADKAAQTSAWLDETFNGDFLRLIDENTPASDRVGREALYLDFYRRAEGIAGSRLFAHLDAILKGWRSVGGSIQTELDWGDLDFAHIPVGVLSQVYESFSHLVDPELARETSVHYTPRLIARLMVDQAFAAIDRPEAARVLDPACGAGIFLVLAFRRLVAERWRADGKRPDTRTIQSILYNQLRGFDVSRSALRLGALALYITAIELNATPRPPKALRFPSNLRTSDPRKGVLFYCGEDVLDTGGSLAGADKAVRSLGSLGPLVPTDLDGSFDLVIGNPPWTRLRERETQNALGGSGRKGKTASTLLNNEFTKIAQRALERRGLSNLAKKYENPDKNPDLPFLWRATEWAKKDRGILAFALPARVIGRTTGKGHKAWQAVLQGVSVTGLLNGADLRKTAVWEAMDLPFCLLFARNALPPKEHRFIFAAPLHDPEVNRQSRFRLDYEAARPVSLERVLRQPWVLKTLTLGTWRDVEVMETILGAFPQTLAEVWKAWNPKGDKTGQGFNLSPKLRQKNADFLCDLPVFDKPNNGFSITFHSLNTFSESYGVIGDGGAVRCSAYWPKTLELYQPPLVIVPKAPGSDPLAPAAYRSEKELAFDQSYYGYSCSGHRDPESLGALLFLLPHSSLFRYFASMTSVSQGADRLIFTKQDFDALPFPEVSGLQPQQKKSLVKLARSVQQSTAVPVDEIDEEIFRLYQLDTDASQTIRDTLFSAAVYRKKGRRAFVPTQRPDREVFSGELAELLKPFFEVCAERLTVQEPLRQPDLWREAWAFLGLSRFAEPLEIDPQLLAEAMSQADVRGASRIFVRLPESRGLLLGLLNQKRWWTITRARLCGQSILREHLSAFGLPGAS
ncbi:MAG: N-6 DNA methylase [Thermoanaerobaculia bacterium]|nr:N-6 DNA methylase [Thermoanaerobaculia bacterium]